MKPWCYGLAWALFVGAATWVDASPLTAAKKADTDSAIPWHDVPQQYAASMKHVIDKAVVNARGPAESFACDPAQYAWFLDHPDRAVAAWRRLGARCASITARPNEHFAWTDEHGSEVVWGTVLRSDGMRIWYAEGKVRPAPAMPLIPVKAVVVLTHAVKPGADGETKIRHQAELYVHMDSKTATALTKMMGTNAQRAAEQGLQQLQLFFSGISWYLERHPEHAEALLRSDERATSAILAPAPNR